MDSAFQRLLVLSWTAFIRYLFLFKGQATGGRTPIFKVYYLVIVEHVFLSLVGSEHPLTVSRPAPLGRVFTTSGPPEVQPEIRVARLIQLTVYIVVFYFINSILCFYPFNLSNCFNIVFDILMSGSHPFFELAFLTLKVFAPSSSRSAIFQWNFFKICFQACPPTRPNTWPDLIARGGSMLESDAYSFAPILSLHPFSLFTCLNSPD